MALRTLALFDGYGGFELGLKLALGPDRSRTVARVERDSHAAATLVARMEEATLDRAPVWDDICTFDGRPWAGRVDLITAGFNCQPFSAAGQRRGVDDERWLWPDIARIIADVGPRFVFLENVPGLVRLGLPHVLADLADLGFDAEWGCLAASEVGASHKRNRFWLLAYTPDVERQPAGRERPQPVLGDAGRQSEAVGHASSSGRSEVTGGAPGDEATHGRQLDRNHEPDRASEDVADTAGVDEREPHHPTRPNARQDPRPDTGRLGSFPPAPDDADGWDDWIAAGGPEPQLRRGADGRPVGLAESLHLGGNGLVPRVAAEAFAALAVRAGIGTI